MRKGCFVFRNGKTEEVKNLGWLLRHWKEVDYFQVTDFDGVELRAVADKWVYTSSFADIRVLHQWLNRPIFKAARIHWLDCPTTLIGSDEYQLLAPRY